MAIYYFRNTGDTNWGTASNWSLTDGGGATGAVPTAADDAYFTSNSGNCTVNTSARVCKTLIFSGVGAGNYAGTITMTNGITVSGNVTLSATMGVSGTAAITVNATATLTSNGKTWSAGLTFAGTSQTYTLGDAWTISGVLTIAAGSAITINGFKIFSSGNLAGTGNASFNGTTSIELTAGTWSGQSTAGTNIFYFINITINGNVTITGVIVYYTGTLTYTSGTVTTTGSTLFTNGSPTTLNTNGITWNNITFGSGSVTLTSNLTLSGLLTCSGVTVNGSFNINASGGISLGNVLQRGTGTSVLNLLGGTWSTTGANGIIYLNTNINGNITISGNVYYNTGTLTYTSGAVNTSGSTLLIQAPTTFNTNIMLWNNIFYSSIASTTLLSDLNIGGLYTTFGTFNGTFNINCYGGIRPTGNLAQGTGTTTLNLIGGTWSSAANYIQINTNIAGNITISGTVYFMTATLTYLSGKPNVLSGSILSITTCTLINIDKINWRTIQINASATITMNKFFSGSALIPTRIQSTGANYTITFQDGFEKITKFTKISNCTVSRPGQLLCITDNSNKGGNVGVRYINQSPNGLPKNVSTAQTQTVYGLPSYYEADPVFAIK